MGFKLTFIPPKLTAPMLQKKGAKGIIFKETQRCLNSMARVVQGVMKAKSTVNFGEMRNAWRVTPVGLSGSSRVATVGNSTVQAVVEDRGAKPHFPPTDSLQLWVTRKLGVTGGRDAQRAAFAIARKRASRRTPAKRTFTEAFLRARPELKRMAKVCTQRITKELLS